jgi:hypothetical protein
LPPAEAPPAPRGRVGGPWDDEDYDVFDGNWSVGRIYQIDTYPDSEAWFWGLGVEAQLSGKKRYGRGTREAAMASISGRICRMEGGAWFLRYSCSWRHDGINSRCVRASRNNPYF